MIHILKNIYLSNRFFFLYGIIILLFIIGYAYPFVFPIAKLSLVFSVLLILIDLILLFRPNLSFYCIRRTPELLSLGTDNRITIEIKNHYNLKLSVVLIDELPAQLQQRDFRILVKINPSERKTISYNIKPLSRGKYVFGDILLFVRSYLQLIERKYTIPVERMVPVYPSIIQMKKYELNAFAKISNHQGIKKIRRLGHSYEFEQIKNYVRGDDYQSVNWKATSRRNNLMVNQYEDERAQQVYSLIDKSRIMKMPFSGQSLLDYSINASLVISNIALLKQDKAGLLSFSNKLDSFIKAEKNKSQLKLILDTLYKEKHSNFEANYEMLYKGSRQLIKGRSLVFLYTNFESLISMERVLPFLRKISHQHLLVVIFFENAEIVEYSKKTPTNIEEICFQTMAQKFISEKKQIVHKLKQYGIQVILTRPEDLSINTINKYLELKSRGMI